MSEEMDSNYNIVYKRCHITLPKLKYYLKSILNPKECIELV